MVVGFRVTYKEGGTDMKAYTDIFQSRKLVEILPLESADAHYWCKDGDDLRLGGGFSIDKDLDIPCWSTSALLEIIRNNGRYELQMYEGGYYFEANGFMTESYFNPIDACYDMIIKLHEEKLL